MNEQWQNVHNLILESRRKLSVSGVTDAESFNSECVCVYTEMGELAVRGKNLKVSEINVETGTLTVEGDVKALVYGDKDRKRKLGVWGKLTR